MNSFILVEASKCKGCNACKVLCSKAHQKEGLLDHPRISIERDENGPVPITCKHCEDMPCAKVCPVRAITVVDQSVRINESSCVGCTLCGLACPFGVIFPAASKPVGHPKKYEYVIPEEDLADVPGNAFPEKPFLAWKAGQRVIAVKCDLCYFREEGPACVQKCPTKALTLMTASDMEERKKALHMQSLDALSEKIIPAFEQQAEGENPDV